jgi:hypothetical protein
MKQIVVGSLSVMVLAMAPAIERPATEAVELCHRAEMVGADEGLALVELGLERAEIAIGETPDDPLAHFALFCNLAKRVTMRGMGLRRISDLRRMSNALDRSLELDPTYPDALAAKGAFLYYAPRFVGGDVDEGERMLRAALAIDPRNPARLVLVDLLAYKQELSEAREEARLAVVVIRSSDDLRIRAGAHAILWRLCDRDRRPLELMEALAPVC